MVIFMVFHGLLIFQCDVRLSINSHVVSTVRTGYFFDLRAQFLIKITLNTLNVQMKCTEVL